MFKKRALLLFFLIISQGLFTEDSPMEIVTTAFESGPKQLSANGTIEIGEEITPISIKVTNVDLFKMDMIIDGSEGLNIPDAILAYELINREYSFLRSVSFKNLNSYRVLISKPVLESEDEENLIEIDDFPYEKIVYTVSNYPRLIVKREYYENKDSRNPLYELEVDNILHIGEYHIATSFIIKDVKKSKEWLVKLNIDTLNYGVNE